MDRGIQAAGNAVVFTLLARRDNHAERESHGVTSTDTSMTLRSESV